MSYQIITDSCCDFSPSLYQQFAVTAVPLTVEYQGQTFDDKNDHTLKDLYNGLRSGAVAQTSAVNPDRWAGAMKPILAQGRDLLVLAFSSGLSSTYQSAVIAAEMLRDRFPERQIFIIDTLCASMGQGLLVYYARKKQEEGLDLASLAAWVEQAKHHICHWFTVDDLLYLKRGGRISAATAVMGAMLQIKPVLRMDSEGHLVTAARARGRKAALEALANKLMELGSGYDNSTVFLSHGDCQEDADHLARLLKERCGVKEVVMSYVGAVIGSHSGPGTVALFFLGSQR